jgi:hypothetical protein
MNTDRKKLKQIFDESKKIMDNRELPFNERWNKSREIEKPLEVWANEMFNHARKKSGKITKSEIKRFVVEGDHKLAMLVKRESDLTKEEREQLSKQREEVMTLWKEDDVLVTVILDYDLDTTLCKYTVRDLQNDFYYRNMIDIA